VKGGEIIIGVIKTIISIFSQSFNNSPLVTLTPMRQDQSSFETLKYQDWEGDVHISLAIFGSSRISLMASNFKKILDYNKPDAEITEILVFCFSLTPEE
jgi:hypothetical protein